MYVLLYVLIFAVNYVSSKKFVGEDESNLKAYLCSLPLNGSGLRPPYRIDYLHSRAVVLKRGSVEVIRYFDILGINTF